VRGKGKGRGGRAVDGRARGGDAGGWTHPKGTSMNTRGPNPTQLGGPPWWSAVLLVLILVACIAAVRYLPTTEFGGFAVLLASVELIKQAIARYRRRARGG
jgi:hypothetical protein